jgi:hypothetical protein
MKFIITNIVTEKTPFGNTIYKATAEDGTIVKACIPNATIPSKKMLLTHFTTNYQKINTVINSIKIGDVIE